MSHPSHKVLIVDDERPFAEEVADYLRLCDYEALTAFTGLQALELLRREQPAAMVLDLQIPDVSGREILGKLRQLSPQTKVIIVTAYHEGEESRQAMPALGVVGYVLKPIPSLIELEGLIRTALLQHGPEADGGPSRAT
jgi:DNA-binding response OmpR family regulator